MTPTDTLLKVTVVIERRADGGLYAYSDDVPGFVLSHIDPRAVVDDIEPALGEILSEKLGHKVTIKPIIDLREALIRDGMHRRASLRAHHSSRVCNRGVTHCMIALQFLPRALAPCSHGSMSGHATEMTRTPTINTKAIAKAAT